eukprot:TRINITY_DN30724_c0_g1_i1.p1 TRINITY_DN30724_c0_g1~~TRINITY_DN30724_c0_g1_i1.p1  ORF type:complete len:335 (-),score=67.25 TRINITY_DN30724_c0_g1_i1:76-1023(-)
MDVKLLRGQEKKVLFMECSSKYVDVIMGLMQAPFGEVMAAISQESADWKNGYPGSVLCESLQKLQTQTELFRTKPQPTKPVNFEAFFEDRRHQQSTVSVLNQQNCTASQIGMDAVTVTSTYGGAWTTNVAFGLPGQQEFEVDISLPTGSKIMLGIAPIDVNIATDGLYNKNSCCMFLQGSASTLYGGGIGGRQKHTLGAHGLSVRMKLTKVNGSLQLQYASDGGQDVTAWEHIPLGNYCPVVCFHQINQSVTLTFISARGAANEMVKPEMQFLVTNCMEVLQSSTTLAVENIGKADRYILKSLESYANLSIARMR